MMAIPIALAAMAIMKGVAEMQAQKQNALNAKAEGEAAMQSAKAESDRQKRIDDAQLGEMKANAGAQGSEFAGSPMLVYLDSIKNATLHEQDIIYNKGTIPKFEAKMQADQYRRQGNMAMFNAGMSAVSSLVGGMAGGAGGMMGGAAAGAGTAGSSMGGMFAGGASQWGGSLGSTMLTR